MSDHGDSEYGTSVWENNTWTRIGIKTSLRDKTLMLMQNRNIKLTYAKIAADTGIGESWLSQFHKNRIPNPGVNTIQTLYEYLSGNTLDV